MLQKVMSTITVTLQMYCLFSLLVAAVIYNYLISIIKDNVSS